MFKLFNKENSLSFNHSKSSLIESFNLSPERGEELSELCHSLILAFIGKEQEKAKYSNFVRKTEYIEYAVNQCKTEQERAYVLFSLGLSFGKVDGEARNLENSMIHAMGMLGGLRGLENVSRSVVKLGEFYLDIDMNNVDLARKIKRGAEELDDDDKDE